MHHYKEMSQLAMERPGGTLNAYYDVKDTEARRSLSEEVMPPPRSQGAVGKEVESPENILGPASLAVYWGHMTISAQETRCHL